MDCYTATGIRLVKDVFLISQLSFNLTNNVFFYGTQSLRLHTITITLYIVNISFLSIAEL